MSSKHQNLQLFFGLFAVLIIAGAFIYSTMLVIDFLKGLKSETAVGLFIASLTIFATIVTNVIVKYYERKNAVEISLRESRKEVYNIYLSHMQAAFAKGATMEMTPEKIAEFNKNILLWASDGTLKMIGELRVVLMNDNNNTKANLEKYANVVLAMRADLGYKNKDLKPKDLLNVFINDVDKYFDEK